MSGITEGRWTYCPLCNTQVIGKPLDHLIDSHPAPTISVRRGGTVHTVNAGVPGMVLTKITD